MNLEGALLDSWLQDRDSGDFPKVANVNYVARYKRVTERLNNYVHPDVTQGATAAEREPGLFTRHGPEHIRKVIERATDLVKVDNCELSAYEVYLLLMSIQLHDVGNALGREWHERRIIEALPDLLSWLDRDSVEMRYIAKVAGAHGGRVPGTGDKDKIRQLPPPGDPGSFLNGTEIQMRLIAAVLRFADELADDRTRASDWLLRIGRVPDESKIYHDYAHALHTVSVRDREIHLDFELTCEEIGNPRSLGSTSVFLLDYVYDRTMKMYSELKYCAQFMRDQIPLDSINVNIVICTNKYEKELETIRYKLEERGYPGSHPGGIEAVCPDLSGMDGADIRRRLADECDWGDTVDLETASIEAEA